MKDELLRLANKAAIYGIGSILNRFISFLLLPLYTSYLTPKDYGVSSILGWMAFLVTPIFSLGMGAAMAPIYFDKDKSSRKDETIWSAFAILSISSTVLVILGVSFADYLSFIAFQSVEYRRLVMMTFISTGMSILSIPMILYLQFEERARLFSLFTIINTIISITLTTLLVVGFRRGVEGIVIANLVTQTVNLLLFAYSTARNLAFKFRFSVSRELLKLGLPLIPSFAFVFLLQQGNRYFIQLFGGLDLLGIYTVGYNFGLVMSIPVDALNVAWTPYFMRFIDRQTEAQGLFSRIVTYYIIGFGVLSLFFYIFAKPVVMIMTQPVFHQAYQVVGLSSSAYFLSGLFTLLLPGIYFAKEVKYIAIIQGLAAIVGISANFLLIQWFQVLGAGVGLVLGYLCMVIFTLIWNHKRGYLSIHYEWRRILTWLAFYVFFVLLALWVRDFSILLESLISLLMLVPIFGIAYLMLNSWEKQNIWLLIKQFQTHFVTRTET